MSANDAGSKEQGAGSQPVPWWQNWLYDPSIEREQNAASLRYWAPPGLINPSPGQPLPKSPHYLEEVYQ